MDPTPSRTSGKPRLSDLVVSTAATGGWAYLVYDALVFSGSWFGTLPDPFLEAVRRLTESSLFWTVLPALAWPLFATVAIYRGRRWAYAVVALLALPLGTYCLVSGADALLGAIALLIGIYSVLRLVRGILRPKRRAEPPVVQLEADE